MDSLETLISPVLPMISVRLRLKAMGCPVLCNVEPLAFNKEGIRGRDLCRLTFLTRVCVTWAVTSPFASDRLKLVRVRVTHTTFVTFGVDVTCTGTFVVAVFQLLMDGRGRASV